MLMLNNGYFVSTEKTTTPMQIYQPGSMGTYIIVTWFHPFL